MGRRGPIAQTEREKALKGTPGKRKAKKVVSGDVLTKLPVAPKHLTRIAGCEWRRAGNRLICLGKIRASNLKALELYCTNYSIAREAYETLKGEGFVCVSGQGGHKMPHPAVGVMNKAQKEARDWLKV